VDPYRIVLVNGVPVYRGERKYKIVDGSTHLNIEAKARPEAVQSAFNMAADLSQTLEPKLWTSTDQETFSVVIRLESSWGSSDTGVSELYEIATRNSWIQVNCDCGAKVESKPLPKNCFIFEGLYKYPLSGQNPEEVHLIPVAGNIWARYLCLLAADAKGPGLENCYVRGNTACNRCWVEALAQRAGRSVSALPIWVVL